MTGERSDLSYEDFVRTRKLYWMQEAKDTDPDLQIPKSEEVELSERESGFIVFAAGRGGVFGVFEDDGETGWFYLYRAEESRIFRCTHVYNRVRVSPGADDVDVVWSSDYETCAVAIWAQLHAFLGVTNGIEMRQPLLSNETYGFNVSDWPNGFRHLLAKTR